MMFAPVAMADDEGSGDCTGDGLVPGIRCITIEARDHCTGGVILSQCYGYTIGDAIEFTYYSCEIVFGAGSCPV